MSPPDWVAQNFRSTFHAGIETELPVAEDDRLIGVLPPPPATPESAAPVPTVATPTAGKLPPSIEPKKIDWNAMPEIQLLTAAAIEQTRIQTERRRWHDGLGLLRTLGLGLGIVLALVLAFEVVQRFANNLPSKDRLEAVGRHAASQWQREHGVVAQPLEVDSVRPEIVVRNGAREVALRLVVTLRLRAPLYGPADSNGTQAYQMLQRSVFDAHKRVVQDGLYLAYPELVAPPPMPPLLSMTHRAGEKLVLTVPVEATRTWWSWQVRQMERSRLTTPVFTGQELSRFAPPYLIFGSPEARTAVRAALRSGREYVLAVQRAARQPLPDDRLLADTR